MRRRDWLALFTLTGLILLFFWRTWIPTADRLAFPVGDFTHQYWPLRRFVARELSAGRLPLWNPYLWGGQPGLADPQAAAFYLPVVISSLLWGAEFSVFALELEVIAHVIWAGWGAYFLARRLISRETVLGPLSAGLTFALSGYLTGFPLQQVTIAETVAWTPWWLLALHHAAHAEPLQRRVAASVLAGIVFAFAILAGHPQSALYLGYLGLVYVGFQVWRGSRVAWWRRLIPIVLPPLLAIGLSAAQLLPTLDFIARSQRAALDYEFVSTGMAWDELVTLLYPNFVGATPLYLGPVVVILALLGFFSQRERAEKLFWAGAAAAGVLLAIGGRSPLYQLFYLGVPGWGRVRDQERVLLVIALAGALLAGWGVAALTSSRRTPLGKMMKLAALVMIPEAVVVAIFYVNRAQIIAGLRDGHLEVVEGFLGSATETLVLTLFVVALFALVRRWPRIAPVGAPVLIVFSLFTANQAFHHGEFTPNEVFTRGPFLDSVEQAVGHRRLNDPNLLQPEANAGMAYGIETLSGNEPLRLAHTADFLEEVPSWHQWEVLAVQHVVANSELNANLFEIVATRWDDAVLARLEQPRPRAWLVTEYEEVDEREARRIWRRLDDDDVDVFKETIVEGEQPEIGGEGTVELVDRRPGYLALRVQVDAPAVLIASEVADPGWRVWIDGHEATWRRAYGLTIAVPVPAGAHDVELRYSPPNWNLARAISLGTLLVAGMLLTWSFVRRTPVEQDDAHS